MLYSLLCATLLVHATQSPAVPNFRTDLTDSHFIQWVAERNSKITSTVAIRKLESRSDLSARETLRSLLPASETIHKVISNADSSFWVMTNKRAIILKNKSIATLELPALYRPAQPIPHIDLTITDMEKDPAGNIWLATDKGPIITDGANWWHSFNRSNGTPYEAMTCIAINEKGDVWGGSNEGAWLLRDGSWSYFWGKRWLIDNQITSIQFDVNSNPIFNTPRGQCTIVQKFMTLDEKAKYFEKITEERHNRRGWVTSCKLVTPGRPEMGFIHEASDNDGLWTAIYISAEAFRYAATHDEEARKTGSRSLEALLDLTRLSGYPGCPARAIIRKGESVTGYDPAETVRVPGESDKIWYSPPRNPTILCKGDTSSDELDGHFFALATWFDYAANSREKSEIREVVTSIMDNILRNDYNLVGHTGRKTKWAIFGPKTLNEDPRWWDQRALNSLQLLTYLKVAEHVSGNLKYKAAYEDLIINHHYLLNTLSLRMNQPWWLINHSDDQLSHLNLFTLLRLERSPARRNVLLRVLEQNHEELKWERSPLYNFIYNASTRKHSQISDSVETLEEWPIELINWTVRNSHRHDVEFKTDKGVRKSELVTSLSIRERPMMKWNVNPWEPDGGDGGRTEEDGSAWLISYWMGRAYGLIPAPTPQLPHPPIGG